MKGISILYVTVYLKLFYFNFSYYHNPTPIKDILYRKNPKIEDAFLQKGLYHRFLDCKARWNNGKDFDMLILCLFYIHVHFPFFLKLLPKNIIANPSARNNLYNNLHNYIYTWACIFGVTSLIVTSLRVTSY